MHAPDDPFLLRLGSVINAARRKRGMTQARLAEEVGIDARSLQRIESARTAPSLARLCAIADALAIPPGALLDAAASPRRRGPLPTGARDTSASVEDVEPLRTWKRIPAARRGFALKMLSLLARERLD